MTINLTPEQVLAGIGVLLVVAWVWRAGSRRAKRAADVARAGSRVVSLAGRVVLAGAVFVGVQWVVIAYIDNVTLLVLVLALPDLIAAHVLTRSLTVNEMGTSRRRGDRR